MKYVCPKCASSDQLIVTVTTCMQLLQDEDGDIQTTDTAPMCDHDWDNDSVMSCECGYRATVADFDTEETTEDDDGDLTPVIWKLTGRTV